jgi:TctA family transporter
VGVYSTNNSLFEVGEVLVFGLVGALLLALKFPVAPILLGYVLGPMLEENFRRTLLLSHGQLSAFFLHPISAVFMAASVLLVGAQLYFAALARIRKRRLTILPEPPTMEESQHAREHEFQRGDASQHS